MRILPKLGTSTERILKRGSVVVGKISRIVGSL